MREKGSVVTCVTVLRFWEFLVLLCRRLNRVASRVRCGLEVDLVVKLGLFLFCCLIRFGEGFADSF